MSTYAKGDPVARAFAAWFRSADGGIHDQPSIEHSGVVEHEDRRYVVLLENGYRTLAVYRVRPDGVLKGLKRPPKELAPDWYTERAATAGEDYEGLSDMGWSKRLPSGRVKAFYRAPDGRERAKTFDRQRDADLWLSSNDVSKARGDWCDPHLARVPYGQWQPKWLETKIDLKPSTRATYERLIASHILPAWERVPLAAITHEDVAAWIASLTSKGLSASRTRQAFRVLSMTLAFAVTAGRLSRNPCDGVPLPRLPETPKRFLTHEQVHALADACGGYRPLVLLLGYTGLRWGEATALRVRSVNLLRRRVAVSEAVVEIDGRLVYGTPKTHRRRSVPIPAFLVDDLAALCAGKGADDLVFTSPEGAALREGNFRRRCFDRAAVAVGLPNLHPHELRHAAASLAVDAGANVKHVQRLLGHKSAAMTLDVYADLFEDGLDELADRMNVAAYQTLADSTQTRRPPGAVRSLPPRREDAR